MPDEAGAMSSRGDGGTFASPNGGESEEQQLVHGDQGEVAVVHGYQLVQMEEWTTYDSDDVDYEGQDGHFEPVPGLPWGMHVLESECDSDDYARDQDLARSAEQLQLSQGDHTRWPPDRTADGYGFQIDLRIFFTTLS